MNCTKTHYCNCGIGPGQAHEIGKDGCKQVLAKAPSRPHTDDKGIKTWLVERRRITDFDMRYSRHYWQHPCGCWTKGAA